MAIYLRMQLFNMLVWSRCFSYFYNNNELKLGYRFYYELCVCVLALFHASLGSKLLRKGDCI